MRLGECIAPCEHVLQTFHIVSPAKVYVAKVGAVEGRRNIGLLFNAFLECGSRLCDFTLLDFRRIGVDRAYSNVALALAHELSAFAASCFAVKVAVGVFAVRQLGDGGVGVGLGHGVGDHRRKLRVVRQHVRNLAHDGRRLVAHRVDNFVRNLKRALAAVNTAVIDAEDHLAHPPPAAPDILTTEFGRLIRQIHRAAVFGEIPTSAQVAGDVRRRQILYGAGLYKRPTKHSKGVSSYRAAEMAIKAPQFLGAEGAYSIAEKHSLARAIRREHDNPAQDFGT